MLHNLMKNLNDIIFHSDYAIMWNIMNDYDFGIMNCIFVSGDKFPNEKGLNKSSCLTLWGRERLAGQIFSKPFEEVYIIHIKTFAKSFFN